ncbi:hypothetical protein A3A76_05085 [Candidatus Woesebacteria bacterium RIFCSPLOWO2_01_FULL_39_23]|uniref:Uncharacterized protein n=2 Tax=Microgenomates group TaxID=1794810 RepID=A0A0H4T791_9BACT|nr:Uncharacterized protein [uncultured Microgenomates bacterium Rifle_16ft_4_minimus_37633]OGM13856.1 MAG: hypothetical protein A2141_04310 [Candidatus Woesebacteria bacterium RBG_16_40_11]OGM27808.1 MAG: hypothetical protein A2628_05305 [Candidatus Woesebacteria bacterium RIFCSPHIGHO2_01_FULL_40_22]OGM36081.1 MAG: hypothetical protein A3E41_04595 [Candidatus Woesebacteria bacterium RIFCSPHIGHO2_12_FULL_38_9]OGM62230.1 MAG: hypothetical protein A3A76_05085 [Candidatus Woesebacteria bacterium RI
MAFETEGTKEKISGSKPTSSTKITLQKAIDMGEYDPEYLATFPEWHTLSRHMQFELIRKALENRNYQLLRQWAEINNMLDFRLKPHLKVAMKNIEKQLAKVNEDREKLYLEFSK